MPVTILCPNLTCRGIMSVPEEVRGRKIRCGACGKVFLVPEVPSNDKSKPEAAAQPQT